MRKMGQVSLPLSLMMVAFLGTVRADSTSAVSDNAPSANVTSPDLALALSCKEERSATSQVTEMLSSLGIGPYFYGYCYSDCSPCWSGNHGSDCPDHSGCTEIPLC